MAKQEIPTLPRNPDALRHSVVAPPQVKQDVDLRNFIGHGTAALPVLAKREILTLPRNPDSLRHTVVAPPQVKQDVDLRNFIGHGPEHVPALAKREVPALPRNPDGLRHTVVAPPKLEQNDLAKSDPANSDLANIKATHGTDAQRAIAQIVALNLHPAEVQGPVKVPSGNRSGAFAASPTGSLQATGTPGNEARTSKAPFNAPAGIDVTAVAPSLTSRVSTSGASPSGTSDVARNALNAPNPSKGAASAGPDAKAKLMAAMRPPLTASISVRQPIMREPTGQRTELENRIFAGRRSYALSVNMPNLNGPIGSWIIHFAELTASPSNPGADPLPIAAPEVLSKSDPAYPDDLIEDGVQGTVVLTATIRADGRVGEVAVIKSLNSRLDRNAAQAFSNWVFRPALKNGQGIEIEAIVTVPFRTRSAKY